jgi:hypothetical protein
VTVRDLNRNGYIYIYIRNDNCGWTKNDNINGWNEKKHKILRNNWKKDLLVVDMVIIKHILGWGKFIR